METTEKDRSEWAAWARWRLLPVPRPPGNTHLPITGDGRGSDEAMMALCCDVDTLVASLERLADAADAYAALQDGATDSRVGLTQPITVAEGNALNDALADARAVLGE